MWTGCATSTAPCCRKFGAKRSPERCGFTSFLPAGMWLCVVVVCCVVCTCVRFLFAELPDVQMVMELASDKVTETDDSFVEPLLSLLLIAHKVSRSGLSFGFSFGVVVAVVPCVSLSPCLYMCLFRSVVKPLSLCHGKSPSLSLSFVVSVSAVRCVVFMSPSLSFCLVSCRPGCLSAATRHASHVSSLH